MLASLIHKICSHQYNLHPHNDEDELAMPRNAICHSLGESVVMIAEIALDRALVSLNLLAKLVAHAADIVLQSPNTLRQGFHLIELGELLLEICDEVFHLSVPLLVELMVTRDRAVDG